MTYAYGFFGRLAFIAKLINTFNLLSKAFSRQILFGRLLASEPVAASRRVMAVSLLLAAARSNSARCRLLPGFAAREKFPVDVCNCAAKGAIMLL